MRKIKGVARGLERGFKIKAINPYNFLYKDNLEGFIEFVTINSVAHVSFGFNDEILEQSFSFRIRIILDDGSVIERLEKVSYYSMYTDGIDVETINTMFENCFDGIRYSEEFKAYASKKALIQNLIPLEPKGEPKPKLRRKM